MIVRRFRYLARATIAACVMACTATAAVAQARVEGRVTLRDDGSPLSGAMVSVQGFSIGAVTGADGRFVLTNVPAGAQVIVARYIGYSNVEMPISLSAGTTRVVDLLMGSPRGTELGPVVVTGPGGPMLPFSLAALTGGLLLLARTDRRSTAKLRVLVTAGVGGIAVGILFAVYWLLANGAYWDEVLHFPVKGLAVGVWLGVWSILQRGTHASG